MLEEVEGAQLNDVLETWIGTAERLTMIEERKLYIGAGVTTMNVYLNLARTIEIFGFRRSQALHYIHSLEIQKHLPRHLPIVHWGRNNMSRHIARNIAKRTH